MRSKNTKNHLETISKKYGIKYSQMQEIAECPFRFFTQIAGEGDKETLNFDSVRIINWGLFSVKEGRKKFLKECNEKKKKDKKQNYIITKYARE